MGKASCAVLCIMSFSKGKMCAYFIFFKVVIKLMVGCLETTVGRERVAEPTIR